MARITEKRLYAVPPQPLIANGNNVGQLKIKDASLLVVGHMIRLASNTQPTISLKVKRIIDKNTLIVGPDNQPIHIYSDVSAYLASDGAVIYADEQLRPTVPQQEVERNTYEEEPVVARRVIPVDRFGNTINGAIDGVVPTEWDDVQLDRDGDGDITEARFYYKTILKQTLQFTYDGNKDLIRVTEA